MNPAAQSAAETWLEFAAAVEFVAEIERPDLTVWTAVTEALSGWIDAGGTRSANGCPGGDPLRVLLGQIIETTPEVGAPGGAPLDAILDAAMSNWSTMAAQRLNDGLPFTR
jgi:hypothetical protein